MEAALPAIVVGLVDEFEIDGGSVLPRRDEVKLEMACLKRDRAAPRVVSKVTILAEDDLRSIALENPEIKATTDLTDQPTLVTCRRESFWRTVGSLHHLSTFPI
jgi:hypothetical protein